MRLWQEKLNKQYDRSGRNVGSASKLTIPQFCYYLVVFLLVLSSTLFIYLFYFIFYIFLIWNLKRQSWSRKRQTFSDIINWWNFQGKSSKRTRGWEWQGSKICYHSISGAINIDRSYLLRSNRDVSRQDCLHFLLQHRCPPSCWWTLIPLSHHYSPQQCSACSFRLVCLPCPVTENMVMIIIIKILKHKTNYLKKGLHWYGFCW